MRSNPWIHLPDEAPYVLPADRPYVEAFNAKFDGPAAGRINLNHPPQPRLGPICAPVVFLQLNPSYAVDEEKGPKDRARLSMAIHSAKDEDLDHIGLSTGDSWWAPRFRELNALFGASKLARSICAIEFFPYRSIAFHHGNIRLPSQEYTFDLVRNAIMRKAVVIVSRGLLLWISAIPELFGNENVYELTNPRSSFVSRRNLKDHAYERLVRTIAEAALAPHLLNFKAELG